MQCKQCSYTGPEGKAYYHISVVNGKVTQIEYISASSYWDRELDEEEWFAEYGE